MIVFQFREEADLGGEFTEMPVPPQIGGVKQEYTKTTGNTLWWYCYLCDVIYYQPTTGYMYECGCGHRVYPYHRQDLQVIQK